jgi:hypothetical protein
MKYLFLFILFLHFAVSTAFGQQVELKKSLSSTKTERLFINLKRGESRQKILLTVVTVSGDTLLNKKAVKTSTGNLRRPFRRMARAQWTVITQNSTIVELYAFDERCRKEGQWTFFAYSTTRSSPLCD